MKYNVGDKVRIKSIDWYNENKGKDGDVWLMATTHSKYNFIEPQSDFCGKVVTIEEVHPSFYTITDPETDFYWTDEMIEGLVEEEMSLDKAGQITDFEYDGLAYTLPEGYQFVDENGNVINAQKIVLEKKHNDKLKLESTKTVREYWSEYARIYIEIYEDEPNECVLTHLYTLEGHRQKGYGRQALIEAESIAKELGCNTTYLKVETDSWMHEWYLRMGYKWYKNANKEYTWLTKSI